MKNDIEKARLLWRCRRGMLELDLLLEKFMNQAFEHLTSAQIEVFHKILQEQDPDLYAWFMGYELPPTQEFKDFVVWFRERICQAKI